jgi:hypothetical protein
VQDPRDLFDRVERIIALMLDVAAGRATIRDTEREYVAQWRALNGDVRRVPGQNELRHPNKFSSLHDWQAYYDENLTTHMEAYGYLRDLYRPLIRGLEAAPLPKEPVSHSVTYNERQQQAAVEQMEREIEEAENPRYVNVVTDVQPRSKKSLWATVQPVLYNPWVVTVGSGLIVALVVALALT